MAGAMRKMALYLGLVEDEDRYGAYDDDYDERDDPREGRAAHEVRDPREVRDGREGREAHEGREARDGRTELRDRSPARAAVTPVGEAAAAGRGSVATMPVRRQTTGATHMGDVNRITTIHPRTYNEAKTIGESFREGTPVIMNLTDMDDSDAKRLVDFAAGLVFGLHGTIERVTSKVFLLSPANVTVTAEDKARMAEGSFFNQS
jgi:cell division inhibitor SepF